MRRPKAKLGARAALLPRRPVKEIKVDEFFKAVKDFFSRFAYDGGLVIVRTVAFAFSGL